MISAKVNVVEGWGAEFARRVNRAAEDAVTDASKAGAAVASNASGSRRRSGTMATMVLLPVVGTEAGWEGGFKSAAWYAGFENSGTTGGITGLHFLEAGRTAAKKKLVDRLNRL
jgi:hypothetical protein